MEQFTESTTLTHSFWSSSLENNTDSLAPEQLTETTTLTYSHWNDLLKQQH